MLGTGSIAGGFILGSMSYSRARESSRGVRLAKVAVAILIIEGVALAAHVFGLIP